MNVIQATTRMALMKRITYLQSKLPSIATRIEGTKFLVVWERQFKKSLFLEKHLHRHSRLVVFQAKMREEIRDLKQVVVGMGR